LTGRIAALSPLPDDRVVAARRRSRRAATSNRPLVLGIEADEIPAVRKHNVKPILHLKPNVQLCVNDITSHGVSHGFTFDAHGKWQYHRKQVEGEDGCLARHRIRRGPSIRSPARRSSMPSRGEEVGEGRARSERARAFPLWSGAMSRRTSGMRSKKNNDKNQRGTTEGNHRGFLTWRS
jgi:hypothetical protein